ncbi:ATP-binding protein [Chromobacterium sp. IIBBL 290-4]|uniref:ATP-binding protein n=1 Tax=Chromobacterium sp. IIBBL 290-4 TaxID=2953890 RepID=UPI0020B74233|nr:ATP-binding protein [Chromobacterium sp. IIBBL 290-4]UTH74664.1 ATP-binding protein [Chromobacterium sp. IIBBL 290-4]
MILFHALRARLRHSIRDRLIAMTSIIVMGMACALTLVIALGAAAMLRQAAERQLSQSLDQSAALLSNFLSARESNLNLWAANPLVEAMFSDPALAEVFAPSLDSYFAKAKAREPWIARILLLQNDAVIYDDSGKIPPGALRLAELSRLPDNNVAAIAPRQFQLDMEQPALLLKRPLLKEGAALPGAYIVLALDMAQIQQSLLARIRIGDNGFVALAAGSPSAGLLLPSRLAISAASLADFRDASRRWRAQADIPDHYRSLALRKQALAGTPLALIGAASQQDIREPIGQLLFYCAAFGLLALAAGVLCAIFFAKRLTHPVQDLARAAVALKDGNLTDPIACASEDEIGQLAVSLETTRHALAELVADLESRVSQRTRDLSLKSEEVARLLDNSGQGFLSMDPALRVNPGFSKECLRIFGQDIRGLALPDLLAPDQIRQRDFLAKTLGLAISSEDDPLRREAYLDLLPAEYRLGGHYYRAEYKPLAEGGMMLILTDVTAQKKLQDKLADERLRLSFIVHALEFRDDLLEALRDYDDFRRRKLPSLLSFEPDPLALLADLLRELHTFKGLFAQASLPSLPNALHELETRIARLRDKDALEINDIKRELGLSDLGRDLEADLAILREKLGPAYLSSERAVHIPVSVLDALEGEAKKLYGDDSRMAALIRRLRYEPFRQLIAPHFKAAMLLAQRQNKPLAPIACVGDEALVDPARYGPFCKSLVHVFRNAVDHGIEDADTRLLADKSEVAAIHCELTRLPGVLRLTIADDGRGLDAAQLRASAARKKLLPAEAAAALDDAAAYRLILLDGFTTRQTADAVSGQGVGLAATHKELLRLGGELRIESTPGQGAAFVFTLPYSPPEPLAEPPAPKADAALLTPLAQVTQAFCRDHLKLELDLEERDASLQTAELLDFTAVVPLGSGINALLGLSMERPLLLDMARRFEPDCQEADIAQLADSVGAEIANTVVGKTTVYLTHLSRHVAMGTPEILMPDMRGEWLRRHACVGIAGRADAGRFIVLCAHPRPVPAAE